MTRPNANREVEALVAKTSRTRLQIQSTWERFENLVAAVESAKEAEQKSKSLVSPRSKRQKRQGDNSKTPNLEDQARLLGKHVKEQIPTDEVECLIRETEENRLRLQRPGKDLKIYEPRFMPVTILMRKSNVDERHPGRNIARSTFHPINCPILWELQK